MPVAVRFPGDGAVREFWEGVSLEEARHWRRTETVLRQTPFLLDSQDVSPLHPHGR